jgi:hypothetical protein
MPRCPYCDCRFGLRASLSGALTCPRCRRELEPKPWIIFLTVVASFGVINFIDSVLPLPQPWRLVVSVLAGATGAVLLFLSCVRYRLKRPPLSIRY